MQSRIFHAAPVPHNVHVSKDSRQVHRIPALINECGQNSRQWNDIHLHEKRCHGAQRTGRTHRMKGKPILIGFQDDHGQYCIPLIQQCWQWQPQRPSKKAWRALEQANSVYDIPSTEQAVEWMHAVCGYPVKSTWLKAIKAGNFVGWPILTKRNVNKYYLDTN